MYRNIYYDENGIITHWDDKVGPTTPEQDALRQNFDEQMSDIEASGKTFDIFFAPDDEISAYAEGSSSAFFGSIYKSDGTKYTFNGVALENPSVVISDAKYFSGKLPVDQYVYLNSDGVYMHENMNLSSILTHEFSHIGPWLNRPYTTWANYGDNREVWSIFNENLVHVIQGNPIRVRHDNYIGPGGHEAGNPDVYIIKLPNWLKK